MDCPLLNLDVRQARWPPTCKLPGVGFYARRRGVARRGGFQHHVAQAQVSATQKLEQAHRPPSHNAGPAQQSAQTKPRHTNAWFLA